MGAVVKRCVVVDKLVVQDGSSARFGRANECTDVLSVHRKGDVGKRDGVGEHVWEYVEDVHCGSVEMDRDRRGGLPREISGIVPGLVVDLGEVQY